MMDWIIHIGYQKTGSKALQHFLANEPHRRPGTGISFPLAGRDGHWHRPMHDQLLAGNTQYLRAAIEEASAGDSQLAVLSFEGFCTMPLPAISLLRSELGAARVVMFLRRQDDLANSMLNQVVMGHQTGLEWIEEFESKIADYDPLLDYRVLLSNWAACFGEHSLLPVTYDKDEDVVLRFGRATGVQVLPSQNLSNNPNPALDAHAYRMLREMKRGVADEDLHAVVQRGHELLAGCMIDTFRNEGIRLIDDQTRAAINSNYRESNEWVRERWFPWRSSLFDSDEP